jgi:serine/threonine protein kinase
MAEHVSVSSFLDVVRKSELLDTSDFEPLRAEFTPDQHPEEAAELLVSRGLITAWQSNLLLQGKFRGFRLGPYRLLDLIGKGGMSSVYLAEHETMHRRCAIKVLPGSYLSEQESSLLRFQREAKAVAALDHPNIVRAYDLNKETQGQRDIHYLVMEFIEGQTIQSIVDQNRPLTYGEAAEYLRQTARGLAHAHERGIVHRDIKPSNLILAPDGKVKILDLGLVGGFGNDELSSLSDANSETLLGTVDYVSPEQALGDANLDERTDLYSLGCVAYFMLTGRPPFAGGTVAERLLAHQLREPDSLNKKRPDIPADLTAIVGRMLAKKPSERYQTVVTVEAEITAWLDKHAADDVLSGSALVANGSTIRMRAGVEDTRNLAQAVKDGDEPQGHAEAESVGAVQVQTDEQDDPKAGSSKRKTLVVCSIVAALAIAFVAFGPKGDEHKGVQNDDKELTNEDRTQALTTPLRTVDQRFSDWRKVADELRENPDTVLYLSFTQPDETESTIANEATRSEVAEAPIQVHGSPQWVNGRFPQKSALRFGGPTTDQWLQLSDEASEAFNFSGSFTLGMWARLRPFTVSYQCLLSKGDVSWRLSAHNPRSGLHFAINEHQQFPARWL